MTAMLLDQDICYRAIASRDARFDGRFFTGVRTTGVYCRPVCPARTPQRRNVQFYPSAAAAEAAGFRPCKRCRPEAAPGTPAWNGTEATVSRALRIIADDAADAADMNALATRLGVSARHLRRLFDTHVGAAPADVIRTHRLHTARRLLTETTLSIQDVAYAAGFGSVRRFNDAFKAAYDAPPSAYRNGAACRANLNGRFELRLTYRPPFAFDAILSFLAMRALPGVEAVVENKYYRAARAGSDAGIVAVTHDPARHALRLRIPINVAPALPQITAAARRVFDLSADGHVIDTALSADKRLAPLVRNLPGLRVPGAWDPFETAVRAVIGQQISVAGARTVAGRIASLFGDELHQPDGDVVRLFPTPQQLADAPVEQAGMPRARADAIRGLARALLADERVLDPSASLDGAIETLCALRGFGPWTAHYVAMRALGQPDAFPTGDLGLRKAASDGDTLLSSAALTAHAETWRPWRAYAAVHLWTSLGAAG